MSEELKPTENFETKVVNIYSKTRSWMSSLLGVLITIVGIAVIFIVGSLEGSKEVRANGGDSAHILTLWREANGVSEGFPEAQAEIIEYNGKEYYFVVEEVDEVSGDVLSWYFAYDGGIEYIFGDYKFYVMTSLTIAVSIIVADINYSSSIRTVMQTETFVKTLKHYQNKKEAVEKHSQYIPDFCSYKNKQAYEDVKRDIVEDAGINYEKFKNGEIDLKNLDKWQLKILRKIRRIKVKKIHASDLLQEHGSVFLRKQTLLPMSQKEHQSRFIVSNFIQKFFTSALGGLTVGFGIVLGNWVLGVTYGLVVFMSFISSIITGTDFGTTTLRNRFLAKADLLNEFDNIKDRFIVVKKPETVKEVAKVEEPKSDVQSSTPIKYDVSDETLKKPISPSGNYNPPKVETISSPSVPYNPAISTTASLPDVSDTNKIIVQKKVDLNQELRLAAK